MIAFDMLLLKALRSGQQSRLLVSKTLQLQFVTQSSGQFSSFPVGATVVERDQTLRALSNRSNVPHRPTCRSLRPRRAMGSQQP